MGYPKKMDGGLFYDKGVSLSRSAVPGMNYPFPSGSFEPARLVLPALYRCNSKVGPYCLTFQKTGKETTTIKEKFSTLKVGDERNMTKWQVFG